MQLKGLRKILNMDTTYGQMQKGQERTNANEEIKKQLSALLCTEKCKKEFTPISERIQNRAIALLGKVLRMPRTEPIAEVFLKDDQTWNLPMPKTGQMRNGGPRINWAIETARLAWWKHKMYEDTNIRLAQQTEEDRGNSTTDTSHM